MPLCAVVSSSAEKILTLAGVGEGKKKQYMVWLVALDTFCWQNVLEVNSDKGGKII
jgi:hypothetical protein